MVEMAIKHVPSLVTKKAYHFDGIGNCFRKDWDLADGAISKLGFSWYHVELAREDDQKLSQFAKDLIQVLCPPLKLQDIILLIRNGPFCRVVNGALVFRANSPGPPSSKFTFKLAARVTENSVITVSMGSVSRLGFSSSTIAPSDLLSEVPRCADVHRQTGIFIGKHALESLLMMNQQCDEGENHVPRSISNLVVHVIGKHLNHLQDLVTDLAMELDSLELQLDEGGSAFKKQMLRERRVPKMQLNLQRLMHVIAHGEQVFPQVKEKCLSKNWLTNELDINSLEELIRRLRLLKKNLRFLSQSLKAIEKMLHNWQADQMNQNLYNLSFLALAFIPLEIIAGVFGMYVYGVPWTEYSDTDKVNGLRNVIYLSVAIVLPVLLSFGPVSSLWRKRSVSRQRVYRKSFSE